MTKTLKIVLFIFGTGLMSGCQTPLDQKQSDLIRTWGEGNRAFAVAVTTYADTMDKVALRHHASEREKIDTTWRLWLANQTNDAGELVYTADDGSVKPMLAEHMMEAIQRRDDALTQLTASQANWKYADERMKAAIRAFEVMNMTSLATNEDIAAAKASAQQLIDSALSAIGGFAGGLGLGATLIP